MLSLTKPKSAEVQLLLRHSKAANFTYDNIGATRYGEIPAGFDHDVAKTQLGYGESVFDTAIEAFRNWKMFPCEMATIVTPTAKIEVGQIVAIRFRTLVAWSVSPSRVVYTIDDHLDGVRRFGFGYGTLPGHVEHGEERFLLEWNLATGVVTYSISAFSRPANLLVKIGYPYARWQQARFRRLSLAAMQAEVMNAKEFCCS